MAKDKAKPDWRGVQDWPRDHRLPFGHPDHPIRKVIDKTRECSIAYLGSTIEVYVTIPDLGDEPLEEIIASFAAVEMVEKVTRIAPIAALEPIACLYDYEYDAEHHLWLRADEPGTGTPEKMKAICDRLGLKTHGLVTSPFQPLLKLIAGNGADASGWVSRRAGALSYWASLPPDKRPSPIRGDDIAGNSDFAKWLLSPEVGGIDKAAEKWRALRRVADDDDPKPVATFDMSNGFDGEIRVAGFAEHDDLWLAPDDPRTTTWATVYYSDGQWSTVKEYDNRADAEAAVPQWVWVSRIYDPEWEIVYATAEAAVNDTTHHGAPDYPIRQEPASNFDLAGAVVIEGEYHYKNATGPIRRVAGEPLPPVPEPEPESVTMVWVARFGDNDERVFEREDAVCDHAADWGIDDSDHFSMRLEPASNFDLTGTDLYLAEYAYTSDRELPIRRVAGEPLPVVKKPEPEPDEPVAEKAIIEVVRGLSGADEAKQRVISTLQNLEAAKAKLVDEALEAAKENERLSEQMGVLETTLEHERAYFWRAFFQREHNIDEVIAEIVRDNPEEARYLANGILKRLASSEKEPDPPTEPGIIPEPASKVVH